MAPPGGLAKGQIPVAQACNLQASHLEANTAKSAVVQVSALWLQPVLPNTEVESVANNVAEDFGKTES